MYVLIASIGAENRAEEFKVIRNYLNHILELYLKKAQNKNIVEI